jgi:hypothetical protein
MKMAGAEEVADMVEVVDMREEGDMRGIICQRNDIR